MLKPTMHQFLNFMIDIETLGTNNNSVVPEVSIVAFEIDTGNLVAEKTWHISVDEQISLGRTFSSGTLAFWLTQSAEARDKLILSMDEHCNRNFLKLPVGVDFFMQDLRDFIHLVTLQWEMSNIHALSELGREVSQGDPQPRVWGNGIRFDLGKITSFYESANTPDHRMPWPFYTEYDVRTMVAFLPSAKSSTKFEGIPHYGLDDCKHQIKYITKIYQEILAASSI